MIKPGSTVEFVRLPDWVALLPSESRRAYEFCLGRSCRVKEIDEQGLCALDFRAVLNGRFDDLLDEIRVEASFLDEVA